jgi:MFS family permease
MIESPGTTRTFYQNHAAYARTRRLGWLMCGLFFLGALLSFGVSMTLWGTYTHVFTFYLKWQDALVALLWFVAFLTLGGCVLVLRFLHVVHIGYIRGVFSLVDTMQIRVRDLSAENLASIFWILNAAFWCFVTVLVGLVPIILIGWTHRITPVPLAFIATALAVLLSFVGMVLSIVFASFIVIGCFGAVSFWQKLGLAQTYSLNTQTVIRCDENVITVIYPDMPEAMFDLNVLDKGDKLVLLALLRERWLASGRLWSLVTDDGQSNIEMAQEVLHPPILLTR